MSILVNENMITSKTCCLLSRVGSQNDREAFYHKYNFMDGRMRVIRIIVIEYMRIDDFLVTMEHYYILSTLIFNFCSFYFDFFYYFLLKILNHKVFDSSFNYCRFHCLHWSFNISFMCFIC